MFHGHHGASGRTPWLYRSMASRVAGSSHDNGRWTTPRRERRLDDLTKIGHTGRNSRCRARHGLLPAVDLNEQGANALGRVDDAATEVLVHPGSERMNTEAKLEVERHVPELDEEEPVSGLSKGDRGLVIGLVLDGDDRVAGRSAGDGSMVPVGPGEGLDALRGTFEPFVLTTYRTGGGLLGPRHEPHRVTGSELSQLPPLGRGHDGRTHEPAQARSVRSEDDRHVPGEIDRPDGVARVVDVRGVQPGLAPVLASPPRSRSDEPDPRPCGIEVHLPRRSKEVGEPLGGEELGCGVRPDQHAEAPVV